jgi:hypothetical protein
VFPCRRRNVPPILHRKFFTTNAVVLVPGTEPLWTWAKHCVWEAPIILTANYSLAACEEYSDELMQKLSKRLFHGIIEIPNANWTHYLEELEVLKQQESPNRDDLCSIYRAIQSDMDSGTHQAVIW